MDKLSTGAKLFLTCKQYSAKEASWDDVIEAAESHYPNYWLSKPSINFYEDTNVYELMDLKDFVLLPLSNHEILLLENFFNSKPKNMKNPMKKFF